MTRRRLLVLLCLLLSATTVAACGGDTLALDPVASAASKTADADSARIAFSARLNIPSAGSMTMRGTGIFDARSKTGWMNMSFQLPADVRSQLGGSSSMEMIFDGHDGLVMYMRSPLLQGLAAGKWVKVDLEKLAEQRGVDLGSLLNANQADPNQALKMLLASSDARVTGTEKIRGVRTTRYAFRVDLRRFADENKALRAALEQAIAAMGVDAYPAEAWIDAQGRVRRLKVEMSMNSPQGAMSMTMVEDLYDFGARAEIFPPPEGEVVDVSALAAR